MNLKTKIDLLATFSVVPFVSTLRKVVQLKLYESALKQSCNAALNGP